MIALHATRPLASLAVLLALTATACSADGVDDGRSAAEAAAASIELSWIEQPLERLASDELGGRGNLTAGGALARQYIVDQLASYGLTGRGREGWLQPFAEGANVVGELRGSDPALADEVVLLSAHYDHLGTAGEPGSQCTAQGSDTICNGAGDNATGVAAVLAMARALAAMPVPPRRSVLFVFWDAEEDGLLGSRHFVEKDPVVPLDKIVAMFSVDTIATELFSGLVPLFALAVESSPELRAAVHANAPVSEPLITTYPVSDFFTGGDQGGTTDHLHFRLAGVPVIFFSSGVPVEYHTPADELDVVQRPALLPITRTILLTAADLANAKTRPSFVAEPAPHLDDARALVALGSYLVANPTALGPGGASLIAVVKPLLTRLQGYLDVPPTSEAEWTEYQNFVKTVINTVYLLGGR